MPHKACKCRCRPTDCADGNLNKSAIGNKPTVLVADDIDILILLCYHWVRAPRGVYSSSQNLAKLPKSNPGAGICQLSSQHWAQEYVITSFLYMPFTDVIQHHMYMALVNQLHLSWSVTIKTLRIRLRSLQIQTVQRQISLKQEKALVRLYKVKSDDNLDSLRLQRYQQKISRRRTFLKSEVLPPTSGAAIYHSMRVYLQVRATVDGKPESAATNRVGLVWKKWTLLCRSYRQSSSTDKSLEDHKM